MVARQYFPDNFQTWQLLQLKHPIGHAWPPFCHFCPPTERCRRKLSILAPRPITDHRLENWQLICMNGHALLVIGPANELSIIQMGPVIGRGASINNLDPVSSSCCGLSVRKVRDCNEDDKGCLILYTATPMVVRLGVHLDGVRLSVLEWPQCVHDALAVVQTDLKRNTNVILHDCERRHRQMNVLLVVRHQPDQVLNTTSSSSSSRVSRYNMSLLAQRIFNVLYNKWMSRFNFH